MESYTTINQLIINSPYSEPVRHWRYDRETKLFSLRKGRGRRGMSSPRRAPKPSMTRAPFIF